MRLRSAAALAVLSLLGCKPGVHGLCGSTADCRKGAYCSLDGICLASSGTCVPACGAGEICSGSTCAALKPVISVAPPAGAISPAFPVITVHVDAAQAIALHGVSLEVDSGAGAVASGSLDAPLAGDNLVTISQFSAGVVGAVTARATLRYQPAGAPAEESVSSVAVSATIDASPPAVSVFVPPASDAVNGWVPRITSSTLEVRANVDDGAGSGAQSATLSFNTCPAAAACTYAGTAISQAGGATVFSFQVPRTVQAAGSEAPLPVTVTAYDVAGNQAQGAGTVQIDDAPPQIGALIFVSAGGVTGEDGKTWFIGGPSAPDVEIAVPVTDAGAGLAPLKLHLDPSDLPNNYGPLDLTGTPASDGIHFHLPASAIRNKEQHLRFKLTASDLLQHTTVLGPSDPKTMIWVDDVAPTIVTAPQVDYVNAVSPPPECDGLTDSSTFKCGRQLSSGGTPHLLADDTVTVRFDAYDCGAGMAAAQPDALVTTAATLHKAPITGDTTNGSQCGNGNKTHHYSFTLNLATQALTFDPPDPAGTTVVQLAANAQDRLQKVVTMGSGALISLWRWRSQVSTNAQPSGSAALIPGSGARQIAVGTTLPASSPNFFVLNADGTPAWHATVSNGVFDDVAAGPSGSLYMVSPPAGSCSSDCNAALNIISPPASPASTAGTFVACPGPHVSFGEPPVIATGPERAVVASTNHAIGATANVFIFQSACGSPETDTIGVAGTDYPGGISANWPSVFLATSPGFVSADYNSGGSGFVPGPPRAYNTTSTVPTSAPPAIALSPIMRAFFGGLAPDDHVHSASQQTCVGLPCWQDDGTFVPPAAGSNLMFTPVFDATTVYAADDKGKVYTFEKMLGTAGWSADFHAALPSPWPGVNTTTVSAPVLLQGGSVLVMRSDGVVAIASAAGIEPLYKSANPLSGIPASPVVDARGTGGVAYVQDGDGWIIALQLASPPAVAGSGVWPRPGRDSCNSRNAASSCQ